MLTTSTGHTWAFAALACVVVIAPVSAKGQEELPRVRLTAQDSFRDASGILLATMATGGLGLATAFRLRDDTCRPVDPANPALGCAPLRGGPYREGWIVGTSIGFSMIAAGVANKRGCSLKSSIPRLLAGAAVGAIPTAVTLSQPEGKRNWGIAVWTPFVQGGTTAMLIRSCATRRFRPRGS